MRHRQILRWMSEHTGQRYGGSVGKSMNAISKGHESRPRRPLRLRIDSVANRKGAELTHCRSALHVPFPVCPDPEHDHEPEA